MARTSAPIWLEKFTREGDFVVAKRGLTLGGVSLPIGAPFPKDSITERRLRQLYDARYITRPAGYTPPERKRRVVDYDAIVANAIANAEARMQAKIKALQPPVEEVVEAEAPQEPQVEQQLAPEQPQPEPVQHEPEPVKYSTGDMELGATEEALPEEKADFLGRQEAAKKKKKKADR